MSKSGEIGSRDDEAPPLSSSEEEPKLKTPVADANSDDDDDDAEANEDLSLKIVEKAMQRAANGNEVASASVAIVTNLRKGSEKKKKNNKEKKKSKKKSKETEELDGSVASDLDTNFKSFCDGMFMGDDVKKPESVIAKVADHINKVEETKPVEASDNTVLRRLLRGPRYFDPPDSGWGACYNCGEEGHAAVNCTAPRRKKPCFVCGSLEHNAKQCSKGRDCFICKKGGHRAKDCPERNTSFSQDSKMCLKCGNDGHDMFSCRNDYCPDDLKEVRCYICGSLGHLCCVEYTDTAPRDVSCYKCGQAGHTGLACMGSRGETSGAGLLSSCYRCGEEGHFARECTSSTKVGKRNRELSTPKKRELSTPKKKKSKEKRDNEVRSAPNDLGKARKKKKILYDEGFPSDNKSKHRGGWSTVDPGDYEQYDRRFSSDNKSKRRGGWTPEHRGDYSSNRHNSGGWRSPATPISWTPWNANHAFYSHASSSHYPQSSQRLHFSNSASYESPNYYHHRFSASRFGQNNRDVMQRHYHW